MHVLLIKVTHFLTFNCVASSVAVCGTIILPLSEAFTVTSTPIRLNVG